MDAVSELALAMNSDGHDDVCDDGVDGCNGVDDDGGDGDGGDGGIVIKAGLEGSGRGFVHLKPWAIQGQGQSQSQNKGHLARIEPVADTSMGMGKRALMHKPEPSPPSNLLRPEQMVTNKLRTHKIDCQTD